MDYRQEQLDAEDRQIDFEQRQEQAARMQPPEPQTVYEIYCNSDLPFRRKDSTILDFGEQCRQLGLEQGRAEIR